MTKARDLANASTALSAVSATELGYLDGVTSAVQTQVDAKLASSTAATTYVANALADAKGDIFVASADNTVTRLPVGSTGDTIVADASTLTGLRYQVPVNVNPILNSAMQIWQKGTSPSFIVNNSQNYQMDRWAVYSPDSGRTVTRQLTGDTTNLPFIQYCARVQRNSGNTATGVITPYQPMESINSIPFAGKTITMSFYARRGANYSATSNVLGVRLVTGTGTDENIIFPGYSGNVTSIDQTATLTTTWQRFSYTATLNSTITEMTPQLFYTPVGTAGAADFFEFTGVQIEVGSVATPFKTYAGTIQGELAACQRYYYRVASTTQYNAIGVGQGKSTTVAGLVVPFPTQMRVAVTTLDYSLFGVFDGANIFNASSVSINGGQTSTNATYLEVTTTGLTQFRPYVGIFQNNSAAYIGFSAEL